MTEKDKAPVLVFTTQDGTEWRFRTWPQLIGWLTEIQQAWLWISAVPGSDPANMNHYVPAQMNNALAQAEQLRLARAPITDGINLLSQHLGNGYALPHPSTDRAARVIEIREIAGDASAKFALAVLQGLASWQNINSNETWAAMMMAMRHEPPGFATQAKHFAEERARYRKDLRRQADEVSDREARRDAQWAVVVEDAGRSATDWSKQLTRRWLRYSAKARSRQVAAMEKLHATDAAFREKMALKAPVEYWEKKAEKHRKAEWWARLWVLIYFPVALGSIGSAFWFTGQYLLSTPTTTLPPGLYIIASAGLASTAGLLFWAGRLLTKLYLSQHHLRQDADERATMTTTYLALTAEQAAAEGDRQIILSALFRSTPDGIVKEEGGLDPSIAAALGKFLAKP